MLAVTLTGVFRRELFHMQVKAIVLFCSADKKIFQNIVAACCCERFFADLAMNQAVLTFWLRMHAHKLVARCAARTHEIDSISHPSGRLRLHRMGVQPHASLPFVATQHAIKLNRDCRSDASGHEISGQTFAPPTSGSVAQCQRISAARRTPAAAPSWRGRASAAS
jgi:hypothetical protein